MTPPSSSTATISSMSTDSVLTTVNAAGVARDSIRFPSSRMQDTEYWPGAGSTSDKLIRPRSTSVASSCLCKAYVAVRVKECLVGSII